MNYGQKTVLREQSTADLKHLKRQAEIALKREGSREGINQMYRWLAQIEKELIRRRIK